MAGCHLRERRRAGAARFPVIRQLQARGRIAGAISEQRLAIGGGNTRASTRRPGGRTGAERGLDGVSKALFHISSYEVEQGRPMLSALVVHKGGQYKGLPGPGFFKLARRLGFTIADSDAAEQDFWDAQVQAAVEHWTEHEEAEEADAKHAAIMKELATIKRMLRLLVHSEATVPGPTESKLAVYLTKPLTATMVDYAEWMENEFGPLGEIDPARLVMLGSKMYRHFQSSEFNRH
jgi:hypothetical protein